MFKIDDCFKSGGIFNDIVVKRFEESFDSRCCTGLWVIPGHVVFTTEKTKVHTCDARPYDFSTSPKEAPSDELLVCKSPILDISFDAERVSTRMFISSSNGDVQIFEYRVTLYEWARVGYFNVNIVSPNCNAIQAVITQVMISFSHGAIYWVVEDSSEDSPILNLYKRKIPLDDVREITQSALGPVLCIIRNCPQLHMFEIHDKMCIMPDFPNDVNLYLILSGNLYGHLYTIDAKLLWRGIVTDSPVDFMTLLVKALGIWSQSGPLKVCRVLDFIKNFGFVINNHKLISISPNGEINEKFRIELDTRSIEQCFVMQDIICLYDETHKYLHFHSLSEGKQIQSLELAAYAPISFTWFYSSCVPSFGFCSNNRIYKVGYRPLEALLDMDPPCDLRVLNLIKNENFHLFCLLRDAVFHEFRECDVPPLTEFPKVLQSEALILALLQSCREQGFVSPHFPMRRLRSLLTESRVLPNTKLRELLDPIVECFIELEKCRISESNMPVRRSRVKS